MNEVEILFHDGWKHIVRKLLARNDLELSVEAGYRQYIVVYFAGPPDDNLS